MLFRAREEFRRVYGAVEKGPLPASAWGGTSRVMTCERVRPLISAYIDGDVTTAERQRVLSHVRGCPECAALLADYRQTRGRLRSLSPVEPPSRLKREVWERIEAAPTQRWSWSVIARSLAGVATAAAAALLVAVPLSLSSGGDVASQLAGLFGQAAEAVVSPTPALTILPVEQAPTPTPEPTEAPPPPPTARPASAPAVPTAAPPPTLAPSPAPEPATVVPIEEPPTVTPDEPDEDPPPSKPAAAPSPPVVAAKPKPAPTATPRPASTLTPAPVARTATPASPASAKVQLTATKAAPTATATKAAATATATRPAPTATVTPSPTPPPTPVPSPTAPAAPVVGASFGRIYADNAALRTRLGAPVQSERRVEAIEQPFERGHMEWVSDGKQIYVLYRELAAWARFVDAWSPDEVTIPGEPPPPGLYRPQRAFGKLWRENATVRERLGWGTAVEQPYDGRLQRFERGLMLRSAGSVIVLYEDGGWQRFG